MIDPVAAVTVLAGLFEVRRSLFTPESKGRAQRDPLGFWMRLAGGLCLLASPMSVYLAVVGFTSCAIGTARSVLVTMRPHLAYKNQHLLDMDEQETTSNSATSDPLMMLPNSEVDES